MRRILPIIAISLAMTAAAVAQPSLPADFKAQTIATPDGAQIYVRSGGSGPVVLLRSSPTPATGSWRRTPRQPSLSSATS